MNERQRMRLEELKQINKERQKKKDIENNEFLNECIQSLGEQAIVLDDKKSNEIYNKFSNLVPFSPLSIGGIDLEKLCDGKIIKNEEQILKECKSKRFYIIWSSELPIIESNIYNILKGIDDVLCVEVDTFLLSQEFDEIIEFYHEGIIILGKIYKIEEKG